VSQETPLPQNTKGHDGLEDVSTRYAVDCRMRKTKRAFVTVTAYRKNNRNEYVGSLLLHSYITGGNVNKDEIGQFLSKQILGPLGGS
jgi:hypothetical protein